jgi:uncharacterized protein
MANPFVHVELQTSDLEKAKSFYTALFDWKLEEVLDGKYTMISVGTGTGGGMMSHPVPGAPSAWIPYVVVEDVVAATEKAKVLGATIIVDVMEIAEAGWLSIFVDPTGAKLGLWRPKNP